MLYMLKCMTCFCLDDISHVHLQLSPTRQLLSGLDHCLVSAFLYLYAPTVLVIPACQERKVSLLAQVHLQILDAC